LLKAPLLKKQRGFLFLSLLNLGKGWFVEPTHRGSAGETDVEVLRRHENDRSPLDLQCPMILCLVCF